MTVSGAIPASTPWFPDLFLQPHIESSDFDLFILQIIASKLVLQQANAMLYEADCLWMAQCVV